MIIVPFSLKFLVHSQEVAVRNTDPTPLSLSFCVCSKWPPMFFVLTKLTDLAAHIMIGPSDGMVFSSRIERVAKSAS